MVLILLLMEDGHRGNKKFMRFEDINKDWKIWYKDDNVDTRSIKRLNGHLPEMECSKQLARIVSKIYLPGHKILDFGCAAGHYYNSLKKKVSKEIIYTGFDLTPRYIKFAKNFFKKEKNVNFDVQSLFSMSKKYYNMFDISYCCNVFHHIPSIDVPLKNLLSATKKYCIIRTLVSDRTHLSKFYYNDKMNKKGELFNFVYQNTYSFDLIIKKIKQVGNYSVKFLDDEFDGSKINAEFKKNKTNIAVTKYLNNVQIA